MVEKVIIVSVHVRYFSYFSFFSLCQSGYVSLHWRDGTWSSTTEGQDRTSDTWAIDGVFTVSLVSSVYVSQVMSVYVGRMGRGAQQ